MFHRYETANYTHINTHLLQLSNTLIRLPAHATQLSAGHLCLFQATTEQLKKVPLPAHYGIAMF